MPKKEYTFNPETLTYEVRKRPLRPRFGRFMRNFIMVILLAAAANVFFALLPNTPKLRRLQKEQDELLVRYEILGSRINDAALRLAELRARDNYVYRPLFGSDTLNIAGVFNEYPASRYSFLNGVPHEEMILKQWKNIDAIARVLYLESVSLDELQTLSKDKERMALAIPAIWPIDQTNLRNGIGAYGRRLHPIYKRYIQHEGIDLGATIGDPVYATANGVVKMTSKGRRGYGQQILIDHGFGYETRYAHLSKIGVVPGQEVVRGEQIGDVGNTGGSTGPHLHYEVIYMGRTVNPVNYFSRDMDEDEFRRIIESAKATTFETDL